MIVKLKLDKEYDLYFISDVNENLMSLDKIIIFYDFEILIQSLLRKRKEIQYIKNHPFNNVFKRSEDICIINLDENIKSQLPEYFI